MNDPGVGLNVRVDMPAPPMHGYDVVVGAGALDGLATRVRQAAPAERYALIVPGDIVGLHGARVLSQLRDGGLVVDMLEFAAGEAHKTRAVWASLTDRMLELGLGRDSAVIALGGGVAGDLAGFVAATYMRGIPVVQVPTTLLAMIDAAVGGKTGVDTEAGKNLVGSFHPPRLVIADPLVLRTLSPDELRGGLAEAVKHGAILDADYFAWIAGNAAAILELDAPVLEELVSRSVRIKADVVMEDPLEAGRRAVLNFGHTVAHALELQAGYRLRHGYAVALGMLAEAAAGEGCGVTEGGTMERIAETLHRCELPTSHDIGSVDGLLSIMRLDKKARRTRPRLALLERIGVCARDPAGSWTFEVPEADLTAAVRRALHGGEVV
jgi:3-dehydroquinate synthase